MTNSELVSQLLQEFRGDDNYGEFRVFQDEANALLEHLEAKDAEIARLNFELAALKTVAAAAGAQYTESPPTEPGYYWFKHTKDDAEPGVLLLDADGTGWLHGDDVPWKGGGPVGTLFGPMIAPLK
jgi:hypothetical protein